MNKEEIINKTREYVSSRLEGEPTGHDYWHTYRVWETAVHIGQEENVDIFVVELAALLHDVADWKSHSGDETIGLKLAREWLEKLNVDEKIISYVCEIMGDAEFKGALVKLEMKTKEGMVVHDADRLDSLGAIGIARCFATGAKKGTSIYDPRIKPKLHKSFEEYKSAKNTSINHFYEKLLLLKDVMKTKAGKKMAEERHKFLEIFLDRFYKEWDGNL